jgi:hypothetical protein
MRQAYPSDITREQYKIIEEELEKAKRKTKERELDLYEILCAVLYLVKEGCTWRAIPHDFPKWQIVYYYFRIWSEKDKNGETLLDKILSEIVVMERLASDKNPCPTMLIEDSKSIQNADTAEEKGYDGGKKHPA